jgi:hypothetical protein
MKKFGFWDTAKLAFRMTAGDPSKEWKTFVEESDAMRNTRGSHDPLGEATNGLLNQVESLINAVDVTNVLIAIATVCRRKGAAFSESAADNWVAGVNAAVWTKQAQIIESAIKKLEKEDIAL